MLPIDSCVQSRAKRVHPFNINSWQSLAPPPASGPATTTTMSSYYLFKFKFDCRRRCRAILGCLILIWRVCVCGHWYWVSSDYSMIIIVSRQLNWASLADWLPHQPNGIRSEFVPLHSFILWLIHIESTTCPPIALMFGKSQPAVQYTILSTQCSRSLAHTHFIWLTQFSFFWFKFFWVDESRVLRWLVARQSQQRGNVFLASYNLNNKHAKWMV